MHYYETRVIHMEIYNETRDNGDMKKNPYPRYVFTARLNFNVS